MGKFQSLLEEYDSVFDQAFKGYNGAEGPFQVVVNMGPVQPPQRKGRVPQYSRDKLYELQQEFNDRERKGVFVKPENAGIMVENSCDTISWSARVLLMICTAGETHHMRFFTTGSGFLKL